MSDDLVSYELKDGIATITMDDGKRNALSPEMFVALNEAFDRAEADEAIVILTGREDVFSAGFDLKVLRGGGAGALTMLKAGYTLTARMLSFPRPVIAACTGHALAMGTFILMSSDYRIGVSGSYKFSANEVAIGLPMPRTAATVLHLRLTPAAYQRAVVLAEYFTPNQARDVGFLDRVVPAKSLQGAARKKAKELAQLDMRAHEITKRRIRADTIKTIRRSIPLDLREALMIGVRSFIDATVKKVSG